MLDFHMSRNKLYFNLYIYEEFADESLLISLLRKTNNLLNSHSYIIKVCLTTNINFIFEIPRLSKQQEVQISKCLCVTNDAGNRL